MRYELYYTLNINNLDKALSSKKRKELEDFYNSELNDTRVTEATIMLIFEHAINTEVWNLSFPIDFDNLPYKVKINDKCVIDIGNLPNLLQRILYKFIQTVKPEEHV